MINGTTFITALGSEALVRAFHIARQANVVRLILFPPPSMTCSCKLWFGLLQVAAMSLEAMRGSVRAFNPLIHAVRPHPGQIKVAELMRSVTYS
jgi:histidine ammonia-lyase